MKPTIGSRTIQLCQITIIVLLVPIMGGWRDISTIDRVKDTKVWAFAVRAPQTIRFAGQTIAADLVLGCVEETYDGRPLQLGSYVHFTQQVALFAKGQYRFDQGKVQEFRSAGGDTSGYGIIIGRSYSPAEFADLISSSARFRIEAELITGQEFFEFDVRKASEVIAKLPCRPR